LEEDRIVTTSVSEMAVAHERWNQQARGETPRARLDRAYAEILQEVRIAQCGVQILLAFLLGLAFTTRFQASGPFQHRTYVVSLVAAVAALAMLVAPTSFNRLLMHRNDLRRQLVRTAHRCALIGLGFVLLAVGSAVILVLSCVLEPLVAGSLGSVIVVWVAFWWFAVPMVSRGRHVHGDEPGTVGEPVTVGEAARS
jgi:Family of unknown function (DUF6328)